MNKEVLRDISQFESLPSTPEKEAIRRKYLNDEIGAFDFYSEVSRYLKNTDNKRR